VVHIPRPEVAVAGCFVSLLAGKSITFTVCGAGDTLIYVVLAKGQILQVLHRFSMAVGNPAGLVQIDKICAKKQGHLSPWEFESFLSTLKSLLTLLI